MLEDKLLVWKLRQGDERAFCRIYRKYKSDLLTIAVLLLRKPAAAEDILHDTFISLAEQAIQLKPCGTLKNYLILDVIGRVQERLRSGMYEIVGLNSSGPLNSDAVESRQEESESLQLLADAMAKLPGNQQEAVILRLAGTLNFNEIAKFQNISTAAAQNRYSYGLDRLKAILKMELTAEPIQAIRDFVAESRRTVDAVADEHIMNDALNVLRDSIKAESQNDAVAVRRKKMLKIFAAIIISGLTISLGIIVIQQKSIIKVSNDRGAVTEPLQTEKTHGVSPREIEDQLNNVIRLFAAKDVNGLLSIVSYGPLQSKLAAAYCLGEMGNVRAIGPLGKLNAEFGRGDPNNVFAKSVNKIKSRIEQQKQETKLAAVRAKKMVPNLKTITFTGLMEDSNGEPASGSIIIDGNSFATDPNGAFEITKQLGKPQNAFVCCAFDAENKMGLVFILDNDSNSDNLQIVLEPLAAIVGGIVDANGDGVPDARPEIGIVMPNGKLRKTAGQLWKTSVDPNGVFAIDGVPIGLTMQVFVAKPGLIGWTEPIELNPGQITDVGDIVLKPLQIPNDVNSKP